MSFARTKANIAELLRLLSPMRGDKVLDVGSGQGKVAAQVRLESGSDVYIVDPDPGRIALAQAEHPELKTCLSESDRMPFQDSFFDKAYSTMALHHFPDKRKSLEEVGRVLKSRGLLVVADARRGSLRGKAIRLWENGVGRGGVSLFETGEVAEILSEGGRFEVRGTSEVGSLYFVAAVKT